MKTLLSIGILTLFVFMFQPTEHIASQNPSPPASKEAENKILKERIKKKETLLKSIMDSVAKEAKKVTPSAPRQNTRIVYVKRNVYIRDTIYMAGPPDTLDYYTSDDNVIHDTVFFRIRKKGWFKRVFGSDDCKNEDTILVKKPEN